MKGLQTLNQNKDKAFITRRYRNWRHAVENFRAMINLLVI